GGPPPTMTEGLVYGGSALVAVGVFVWLGRRAATRRSAGPAGGPPAFLGGLLFGLFWVPLVGAACYARPLVYHTLVACWLTIGAGCGEEVFYRGYVQSRLNEVFGRPFRVLGLRFGVGLLVSSVLFGFLHALNSVDYFQGRFTFAWGFGVATIPMGVLYG